MSARKISPKVLPHVSDTLGWILYRRGIHQRALALLRESASRSPDSPMVQSHLRMAALKTGDKEPARKALAVAAKSPVGFAGKEGVVPEPSAPGERGRRSTLANRLARRPRRAAADLPQDVPTGRTRVCPARVS